MNVEYTEQDVREMREQGIPEDELPGVGVHKFQRSRFITDRRAQKIKISIYLDADILDFFKDLAAKPNAAPYQTQINNELRAVMEKKQSSDEAVTLTMLENPKFLSSLAEKLKNAA
jgi:uncharacterized protein (DUF4415 family)